MKAKASPAKSEGARLERKAMRAYLRRLRRKMLILTRGYAEGAAFHHFLKGRFFTADGMLSWVLQRQKRFDRRPGGLGR